MGATPRLVSQIELQEEQDEVLQVDDAASARQQQSSQHRSPARQASCTAQRAPRAMPANNVTKTGVGQTATLWFLTTRPLRGLCVCVFFFTTPSTLRTDR